MSRAHSMIIVALAVVLGGAWCASCGAADTAAAGPPTGKPAVSAQPPACEKTGQPTVAPAGGAARPAPGQVTSDQAAAVPVSGADQPRADGTPPGLTVRPVPDELPLDALDPISRTNQELALRFPTTYAGFNPQPDLSSYTVRTVGEPSADLVAAVRQAFAGLPDRLIAAGFGAEAVRRTPAPAVSFDGSARFSLVQIQDALRSLRSALDSKGVWGVGLDTPHGQIVLDIDGSPEGHRAADEIVATHPAGLVRVEVWDAPVARPALVTVPPHPAG